MERRSSTPAAGSESLVAAVRPYGYFYPTSTWIPEEPVKIGFYCLAPEPALAMRISAVLSQEISGRRVSSRIPDRSLAEFREPGRRGGQSRPREKYESARGLRAVFVPLVGINHLPADLLLERGVEVFNCHGNAFSVAERALAMTLAAFGRVDRVPQRPPAGKLARVLGRQGTRGLLAFPFQGKSCAVLGTGDRDRPGASLPRGLRRARVTGYRRKTPAPDALLDRVTADLAEALRDGEVVFVALPLTAETEGLPVPGGPGRA
ncbi:MAG: hypothetical protein MZV63_57585 [Marinilabiliales bacterium]|nr:hypothetical protein [Marinilabiliales bacterium]